MVYPEGVDISNNNGAVNWDAVAASGRAFAFVKSTEGTAFRDRYFAQNWAELKRLGLARGAYHFGRPSENGPEDEASFFVAIASEQGIEPGDMLALDLEDPNAGGSLADWTLRFLKRIEALAGFAPLIYTSPGYVVDHMLHMAPELARFGLWCASWGVPTPPQAPPPWDLVAFHQYAVGGAGSVSGVSGECDLNRFNGPLEHLRLYGKPGAAPIPVPLPVSSPEIVQSGPFAGMTLPQLQEKAEGLLSATAYLGDTMADGMTALAKEAQRVRVEQVGSRP